MKQKKILLMLAVAAIMAACEPEQVVTPEPEARTPHLAGGYGVESPCGFLDDSVRS